MLTAIKDRQSKVPYQNQCVYDSLDLIVNQMHNNDLTLDLSTFETLPLIHEIQSYYDTARLSEEKIISLDRTSQSVHMTTDRRLLIQVVSQMIENAVEASPMGQSVDVGCFADHNHCTFWVVNEAVMPDFVREHIFKRGFSTKSQTRGLGTYSIKLITETYLKGLVNFTSKMNQGTVFRATFPLKITTD